MPSLARSTGIEPRSLSGKPFSVLQDKERPTAPWYPQAVELPPPASLGSPWDHQALGSQEMQTVSTLGISTLMEPSPPAGVAMYTPSQPTETPPHRERERRRGRFRVPSESLLQEEAEPSQP